MELTEARSIAEKIQAILEPSCERIVIAGSIRREKPDVGDIELLCIPKVTQGADMLCIPKVTQGADMLEAKIQTMIHFDMLDYRLNKRGRQAYGPKNKLLLHVPSGIGVDIFSTTEECWPVALVVRTGGKETNIRISRAALKKGYRFHAYGSGFSSPGGDIVCRSEREVFETVGLAYRNPWERE